MAVFTPRALQIPNMRTGYTAENSAFSNLGQTLGSLPGDIRKEQLNAQKQQALVGLGQDIKAGKFQDAASKAFALGDTQGAVGLLGLQQKQLERDSEKTWLGGGGGLGTPTAPVALGSPNEVESRFMGGIQKAGLTNPNGLAAVAAYGKSESGWSPENVNKTWSDPSESGAAGTSGGTMSWRADRLQNLQNFARQRGEQGNGSPETQAAFLAQEDPTLVPRLNAAKTPQEANQIMADAWRFAGYNRPGQGEFARREGLTGAYAQRYAGAQPTSAPAQPVQVAENEADVQRLEQAQAAAPDAPAPGAANAQGFAIPGGESEYQQRSILSDKNVQHWQNRLNTAPTDRTRAIAQSNLNLAIKDAEQRFAEGKSSEAVREFREARKNGWTQARTPIEYAKEKADATRATKTASQEVEQRKEAAAAAGIPPSDPRYQTYILTGKTPREDAQPLTATDKKAILEADEAIASGETALRALHEAKGLSKQAMSGPLAGIRAKLGNNVADGFLPDWIASPQGAEATANLENTVTANALSQMKAIFGGNPTEGERKILLDIQGSINQPDNVRQGIYDRAIRAAEARLAFNRQRAEELRGNTYYKPQTGSPGGAGQGAAPPAQQPQQQQRQPTSPPANAKQASDGKFYLPDPDRPGKYLMWQP